MKNSALVASSILLACTTAQKRSGPPPAPVPSAQKAALSPAPAPQTPENPLFNESQLPFRYPPFDKLHDADYAPALEKGMADQRKEIDVIAAVVVGGTALSGGKGNLWGTFIGVLLLGCISNALNILGVSPYWQYIMRGGLIIVAVLLSYLSGLRSSSGTVAARKAQPAEIKGSSVNAS